MNYKQANDYLYSLGRFGMHFGLDRMKRMMDYLGRPHERLEVIHVTGTNGKGSTAVMIASILRKAGYKVGVYISPHLDSFRERIRVNEKFITEKEVSRLTSLIKPIVEKTSTDINSHPTFFEAVTAMAFKYFYDEGVDYAVLEIGLGGRLDATNIADSKVCVITNIDYEHTEVLGNSLESIAREKAGIIKKGSTVVTAENKAEVLGVFESICKERGAKLFRIQKEFRIKKIAVDSAKNIFSIKSKGYSYSRLSVGLIGEHQINNACMAVAAAKLIDEGISEKAVRSGLASARWPGRLEIIGRRPLTIMDAAHNPAAMEKLAKSLKLFKYKKMILVLGVMKDKDIPAILEKIAPKAALVIINKPRFERAAEPELVLKYAKEFTKAVIVRDVKESIELARLVAGKGDLICITGSIYMLSEARSRKLERRLTQ